MYRSILLKGWTVIFLFAVLVTGCDKDDGDLPPQFEELSFDSQEVIALLPDGLLTSDDPKAEECVGMIEDALDMSSFQENLIVPDDAVRSAKKASADTWSWTWSYMGETWTFYWTYNEDSSKKYWNMEIQYGQGDKYDYISAWEMKDGSAGEVVYSFSWVELYDQEYTDYVDLHWTYRWEKNSSGNYSFYWSYDADDTEHEFFLEYSVVVNADGTGSVDYYMYDVLVYHMEWDALGNGSWHYYFGDLEQSGTWTAG